MIWYLYILWNNHHKSSEHLSPYIVTIFFLVMRNFKIYSLTAFRQAIQYWAYSPCCISQWIIYFITGSLYFLTSFTHFVHFQPLPLATTNLFSLPISSFFKKLDFIYKWNHILFVFLYLTCSLGIMPSRSIHVVAKWKDFTIFYVKIICQYVCVCVYVSHFLYPFIHWWTLRLLPYLG